MVRTSGAGSTFRTEQAAIIVAVTAIAAASCRFTTFLLSEQLFRDWIRNFH
jgi:hypothetical protein